MYLVTDRSTLRVLSEYPLTFDGYRDAVMMASCLAQYAENHPSGLIIEKRLPDQTVKQIIDICAPR